MNTITMKKFKKGLSPVLGKYHELEVQRGLGCYLYSTDGDAYLDFSSGIAVASTGHCHPDVVNAIKAQADTLIHPCLGVACSKPPVLLADVLTEILGGTLNSVFFAQSGSESVEAAIKLAKYVTKKSKIIAFSGAFHGRTLGALSVTHKEKYREGYAPLLDCVEFLEYPTCYRCPWKKNVESCFTYCTKEIENSINNMSDDVAAVIIEPILGEGGYSPAPVAYLKTLEAICKEKGILVIYDEIQSGMGRTGTWCSFQNYDLDPDIVVLSKGIASGMPLGACISSKEIMEKWLPGAHGSTFTGNPVTCAAGLATIQVLKTYINNIPHMGLKALLELESKLNNNPYVGDIRGLGLMIGIEFVKDQDTKEPNPELVQKIMTDCLEKGLIVICCGTHNNVIRIIPPLVISKEDLEKGLGIFLDVVNANCKG